MLGEWGQSGLKLVRCLGFFCGLRVEGLGFKGAARP